MANPYINFLNLLPKQVRFIAKVISIDTVTGTVHVERMGGNNDTIVKGGTDSYAINDYVFVVDGSIVSKVDNVQSILQEEVI